MLVVQVVKEINELRYVLCPKRMTDAQFWHIYFRLANKYLPEEASDPDFKPQASPATQGLTFNDIQVGPCTSCRLQPPLGFSLVPFMSQELMQSQRFAHCDLANMHQVEHASNAEGLPYFHMRKGSKARKMCVTGCACAGQVCSSVNVRKALERPDGSHPAQRSSGPLWRRR